MARPASIDAGIRDNASNAFSRTFRSLSLSAPAARMAAADDAVAGSTDCAAFRTPAAG